MTEAATFALSKQSRCLRFISPIQLVVSLIGAMIPSNFDCAAQQLDTPRGKVLSVIISGPLQVVYSHSTQACETWDVPDAAARAFRDSHSRIHLIATHSVNRALVGPDFDHLTHSCETLYEGAGSAEPNKFNDQGWLESFYTEDGQSIIALISNDYHPYRHRLACGIEAKQQYDCWYNSVALAFSTDAGETFNRTYNDSRDIVLGPERRFTTAETKNQGAFVPSNIMRIKDHFYVMISVEGINGSQSGECLLRAGSKHVTAQWEMWDGMHFANPYRSPYTDSQWSSKCIPVGVGPGRDFRCQHGCPESACDRSTLWQPLLSEA